MILLPRSRKWLLALTTLGLFGGLWSLLYWRQQLVLRAQVYPQGLAVGEALTYADNTYPDNADGKSHWRWEFGQGSVSQARAGTFHYDSAGTYLVRLLVDDKLKRKFLVRVKESPARPDTLIRLLAPTVGYPDEQLMFQTTGATAHQFTWYFGDGAPPSHDPVTFHAFAQPGTYRVKLKTDVARHDLTQEIRIESRFSIHDKITVVDSTDEDIRRHLQHIANGEEVNGHYEYLLNKHLRQPNVPVAAGALPPSDFYSYCMNLQFDSGWVIDAVVAERASSTSPVTKLSVTQHKRGNE